MTPDPVVVPVGGSAQLKATGLLETRESIDMTDLVDWRSASDGVASVSDGLDAEGALEGLSAGETTIFASYDGIESPAAVVTVTDAELLRLTVTPADIVAAAGETVQLAADAGFSDGSSGDVTGQVRWITDDGDVAQLESSGLLSAVGAGETAVHAEWEGVSSADVPVNVTPQSSGKPDLVISSISGESVDGLASISVQVENVGDASATEFWVDAWGDPDGTPQIEDIGDDYVLLKYLGPSQTETLHFDLYADDAVYVLADTNDDVDESSESNNGVGSVLSSGGGTDAPDLSVSFFESYADEYSIYYYLEIENSGDVAADSFYVDLFVDRDEAPTVKDFGDEYTLIEGLGAGESASWDVLVDTWCGWCWTWVLVDSLDWVEEANEEDNAAGPYDVYSK